ncbi:MAG: Ltp family lipoprotein [Corynebacterium sp.]|uniref:Ltp family lipoprotein n=1 Tax=Corynebacterium sp. TaxID=1720 RepID=UPI0026DC284E|nr:Ltp family lipoprotein [Corynebacterium sp.]MDO5029548.1 Ltp family lipoprotein [Corynebacterium sp.]
MSDTNFSQNPYGPQNPQGMQTPQDAQFYQHPSADPAAQFPPAPQEKKKGGCFKWGGIAAAVIVVVAVASSLGGTDSDSGSNSAMTSANSISAEAGSALGSESLENADFTGGSDAEQNEEVPAEYKSALRKAKTYSEMMHMSKQGIYDQLTSEYGEKFSAEAAQYAMDNLEADWNNNALEKARSYQDSMAMSPDAIYEQLTSEYGEQFTPEEAQYAVDNL